MSEPRSVLVVENEASNAELAAVLLSLEGWRVDHAADGAGALVRLAVSRPDVVLCDLLMPGMDGLTLLREMARAGSLRSVPVVLFTAAGDDLVAQARQAHPRVGVLRKPAGPEEILEALATAVALWGEGVGGGDG